MKLLLASTAILSLSSGLAMAEVTLSGSARMGIIDDFGDDNTGFTSRARVEFTLSGESDSGISFGASFRADNATGANAGTAGSVFVSGAFGKLSMGDVDGAANAAAGQVNGVGLTGLGDMNELTFIGNGGADYDGAPAVGLDDTVDPSALYEYTAGNFALYLSSTQLQQAVGGQAVAVAGKYTAGNYSVSLGYENLDAQDDYVWEQLVLGGSATFGAVTLKAVYADGKNNQGDDWNQYAVSASYTADALTITAFVADDEDLLDNDLGTASSAKAYGLGAAYDLGGGASVVGGYVKNQTADTNAFDLGLSFAF